MVLHLLQVLEEVEPQIQAVEQVEVEAVRLPVVQAAQAVLV